MKVKDAFKKIMENDESREQFQNNPIETLKAHGVDTNSLPQEVLDKIAGGASKGSNSGSTAGAAAGATAAALVFASI
jgi:hypothetical protein